MFDFNLVSAIIIQNLILSPSFMVGVVAGKKPANII